MLRGNHESKAMSHHFTFREEVITKYDEETFNIIMESFNSLPIASLVVSSFKRCQESIHLRQFI